MWNYRAPLRDIDFVLKEWLSVRKDWCETSAFADLDESTSTQILDAAARFAPMGC